MPQLTTPHNAIFYVPFAYYYKVRLRTIPKLLSWMLIYLFPTFWYMWFSAGQLSYLIIANYLLILIATFSLYELGYIHNDTFATQHEKTPTLRLSKPSLTYFYSHSRTITLVRYSYTLFAAVLIITINRLNPHVIAVLINLCLIPIIFSIYNAWRSHLNAFLYPILVFSRYLPFVLLYSFNWQIIALLFLSFPCLNMLERFSMPNFRFPIMRLLIPTENSKTLFRVFYYLVLCLILPFCCSIITYIPMIVLFIYRLLLLILLHFYTPKRYLQG